MISKQVFKKKKRYVVFLLILFTTIVIAFVSGFAFARATENTKWLGWLVYYQYDPFRDEGMQQYPGPSDIRYSRNIVLGLRHDGVVVWKRKSPH